MNRNVQPQLAPAPQQHSSRRRPLVLLALLSLLLLGAGAGGAFWWHQRKQLANRDSTSSEKRTPVPVLPTSGCSDDDDPKYLERLEFGPPLTVPFDRAHLDALADRPLPPLEVYPWQPEGLVAVLGEHRMRGNLFAVSPDGKHLAVARAGDSYVRIGSVTTLHEQRLLTCPGGAHALAWSPKGDHLAVSCAGAGGPLLFDVRDLEHVPGPVELISSGKPITSLSWSGDAKYLLGGDQTPGLGTGWVWEVRTRKVVNQLKHTGPVLAVAFSPVPGDYRALTAGGFEDGSLHLWDALTGTKERLVIDFRPSKTDKTVYVAGVAFSPDGQRALSCHPDLCVRLWDLNRFELGKKALELRAHPAAIKPLVTSSQTLRGHPGVPVAAFSPDGLAIATASQSVPSHRLADGIVWLWNARDGKQVRRLAASAGVSSLAFLSEGDRIAFAGTTRNDWNVHVHEVKTGKEHSPPVGHLGPATSVAVSPDGRSAASGSDDFSVRVWDLAAVRQRHDLPVGNVWDVGYHPDGKRAFYYGGLAPYLCFADVESGKPLTPRYDKQHGSGLNSAAITGDGRYAVTSGHGDRTVRMWRLADGRQVRQFAQDGTTGVTVAPDMRRAIVVGGPKTRLLQLRCQEVKHEWAPTTWAPFLPDGRAVFFGGAKSPSWKIAADKVEEAAQFEVNLGGMARGNLSADGKWVAALLGNRVAVFELKTGRQRWAWAPPPHFYAVRGVALSPDGAHLLTANGDGTVYVVRLP